MKKIPTLFEREFSDDHIVKIKSMITKGMEWVMNGEGIATIKYDGSCCAIINGKFYKRYNAKHGKSVPKGAIKCQKKADPVTGHLPCWIKCDRNNPADKWFWAAYDFGKEHYCNDMGEGEPLKDATYEAVGLHFQGNPYNMDHDILIRHGENIVYPERSFDGIREWLLMNRCDEGLVFWKDGVPQCKIKQTDFGFEWNNKLSKV